MKSGGECLIKDDLEPQMNDDDLMNFKELNRPLKDDLLLPEDVAERMVREIPNAKRLDVKGTNHYSILFQPNKMRDQTILKFLNE